MAAQVIDAAIEVHRTLAGPGLSWRLGVFALIPIGCAQNSRYEAAKKPIFEVSSVYTIDVPVCRLA